MPSLESALPFVVCGGLGALLAIVELFQAFGKWIGRHWGNRYVLALIVLNILSAVGVYAFLRFVLGVENGLWQAVVTGVTFPTILRSHFTFYRPVSKTGAAIDTGSLSVTLDGWYRRLQNRCYDEVNSQIASDRSQMLKRIRDCLSEKQIVEALSDHIASELLGEQRKEHAAELQRIQSLKPDERKRLLAVMMIDLMPEPGVKQLLKGCK
ncbi:MAG TPA: hypothetical protein VIK33_05595 [Anaerolineae bacterium]